MPPSFSRRQPQNAAIFRRRGGIIAAVSRRTANDAAEIAYFRPDFSAIFALSADSEPKKMPKNRNFFPKRFASGQPEGIL